MRVGKVINQHRMAKHFEFGIQDALFAFHRKRESIDAEASAGGPAQTER